MRPDDGCLIPKFVSQALRGEPLTVSTATEPDQESAVRGRPLEGVRHLMRSPEIRPVNFGNPVEYTIREVAGLILELSGSESKLLHEPLSQDDPTQCRPDITRARGILAAKG